MKFNPKLPHGVVTGHPVARFEQNGVLFTGGGDPVKASGRTEPDPIQEQDPNAIENAKAFLRVILAGGPVTKAAVYKEAESNNQNWSDVTAAFAQMKGIAFKRGQTQVWRLNVEEVV